MSAPFTPVGSDGLSLDVTKAVRYVEGMVLGVGDFQQEHVYLAGLARDALRLGAGTGTLSGLAASVATVPGGGPGGTNKIEARVGPGVAFDGRGRTIRVPDEQCADLAAWVAAQTPADLDPKVVGGPLAGTLPVWLTVAYTRTATDAVPVPGEPCRSDDQLTAESRWSDGYRLSLALQAPDPPRLRAALQQYVGWTRYALTFTAVPPPADAAARDALLASVEKLLADSRAAGAAAVPPRFLPATPGALTAVAVNEADFDLQMMCLDAAAVVFATELLPAWLGGPPADDAPEELLLAELTLAVKKAAAADPWALDLAATPGVSSRARPVALAAPTLRVGPRVP